MAVAAHWFACFFFLAARLDAKEDRAWARRRAETTWGEEDMLWVTQLNVGAAALNATASSYKIHRLRSVVHCYCRAYYWALVTMITTGFGDICPHTRSETVVCILSMYVGMSISCAAIANLTLLVMSGNASNMAHRDKLDDLRQYASYEAARILISTDSSHSWTGRSPLDARRGTLVVE